MDDDGISQVTILIFLLIMSAFFSACEAAFNDYSRIRMKNLACSNNKRADLVIRLDEKNDNLMSTILIFNNTLS
ncbi:MAG: transporter [Sedimentibacter sp.]|nr:transporter [Sedimentibacter sp.]